ncbi:MAG: HD domain-containing protein [Muribaculaceae bacterium]|nr:HD domain-containing protein [Muribaculaceae bacterium]
MIQKAVNNYSELLKLKVFRAVGDIADSLARECYVVGGFVRDLFLGRHSKDIDFVSVGSGIEIAEELSRRVRRPVHVFRSYGTAQIKWNGIELEFVGARRESYNRDSRNPIVEDGTLEEDIARRDFTINAMALRINSEGFGNLVDLYDGLDDLQRKVIRTPLDPDITFSDDPLRMMRAIRFATQLNFDIAPDTFDAITRNAQRITIIKQERITEELRKIMRSPRPSIGWKLLADCGLLKIIFPELAAMRGIEVVHGRGHKDNFYHTIEVLDNVALATDDEWTRWSALLHDIAKPVTKRWDESVGWTFHNHNFIGSKMVPRIFSRLGLPMGAEMRKVQKLVELHMRPIALVEDEVTDSAVRRLLNYAEEDIEDLMILARADITSKNMEKKQRLLDNFDLVDRKFADIRTIDSDRAFRPALDGNDIMAMFGLSQSPMVGFFMQNLTRVSKDCEIGPTREDAIAYLLQLGTEKGLVGDPSKLPDPELKAKNKKQPTSQL